MSSNNALQPVVEHGWLSGLANLLRKENSLWWHTRKWWVQSLIWLLISNGLIALLLWVIPALDNSQPPLVSEARSVFIQTHGVFAALGVMVLAQGLIVREKQSGTAAWVMSNPVSRSAFILSKLIGHGVGIFATIVLLQGLVAYLQFSLRNQALQNPSPFIAALALVSLHMLFYLTLALMLGTFFNSNGPVIGISIGLIIGQNILGQILAGFIPWISAVLPQSVLSLAGVVGMGQRLPSGWSIPVIITSTLSAVFILIAIWRFSREEF